MDETIISAFYYGCCKYYNYMTSVCSSYLQKNPGYPSISMWKCISYLLSETNLQEGIRELKNLVSDRDCCLASLIALLNISQKTGSEDISVLSSKLLELMRKPQSERAYLNACLLCYIYQQPEDAIRLFKQGEQLCSPEMKQSFEALQLWMSSEHLKGELIRLVDKAAELFKRDQKNIWVFASYLWMLKHVDAKKTLDLLAKTSIMYPTCIAFRVERLRVEIMGGFWDSLPQSIIELNDIHASKVVDLTAILAPINSNFSREHLESLLAVVMSNSCYKKDGNLAEIALESMLEAVKEKEPRNWELIVSLISLLLSLPCTDKQLLTIRLLCEHLITISPLNPTSFCLLAKCLYRSRSFSKAAETFEKSLQLNGSDLEALEGKILSQVQGGKLNGIEKEVDFLCELLKASEKSWRADLLKMRIVKATGGDNLENLLPQVIDGYWDEIKLLERTYEGYKLLNFPMGLEILDSKFRANFSNVNDSCEKIISKLYEFFPGSPELLIYSSIQQKRQSNFINAVNFITKARKVDPNNSKAAMIHAEILLDLDQPSAAIDILDTCQSLNFDIRNNIDFLILKIKAYRKAKLIGNAQEQLIFAEKKFRESKSPNTDFLVQILFEKAQIAIENKDFALAKQALQEAEKQSTSGSLLINEIRMKQFDVELQAETSDPNHLLAIVQNTNYTPENENFYRYSRIQAAKIYLEKKNDKVSFVKCYQDLVQTIGKLDDYMSLADAFQRIGDFRKAQLTFESMEYKFPDRQIEIAIKVGLLLINSFNLDGALELFQLKSQKFPECLALKFHLAVVLKRLGRLEEAKQILEYTRAIAPHELSEQGYRVLSLCLLGDIYSETSSSITALETYKFAQNGCLREITSKYGPESDIGGSSALVINAYLLNKMAVIFKATGETERAVQCLNEILKINPTDSSALLNLARLSIDKADYEGAKICCSTLLKNDPDNQEAHTVEANILFRNRRFKDAHENLRVLLSKNPTNWDALWMLIEVCRRANHATFHNEVEKQLLLAEEALGGDYVDKPLSSRSNSSEISTDYSNKSSNSLLDISGKARLFSGYHFCRGLYFITRNRLSDAIKSFIEAKYDVKYANLSMQIIFDLYLSFDLFGKNDGNDFTSDIDRSNGISVVKRLLNEFPLNPVRKQTLVAGLKLISNSKPEFESTIADLVKIVNLDNTCFNAIYILALLYVKTKQHSKAKQLVQRITKQEVSIENVYDYEKCLLLYAELLILQPSKNEPIAEVLKECLSVNSSSARAYEMLGALKEKENDFQNAAKNYELAWIFSFERNIVIGTKLANINLRAKRFVEAIDVAKQILDQDDNSRIKDLIDKARFNLKMAV